MYRYLRGEQRSVIKSRHAGEYYTGGRWLLCRRYGEITQSGAAYHGNVSDRDCRNALEAVNLSETGRMISPGWYFANGFTTISFKLIQAGKPPDIEKEPLHCDGIHSCNSSYTCLA